MVKDLKLFNKIASAINSSFGTSGPGEAGLTLNSVKFELLDEKTAVAKCVQTVVFTDNRTIASLMKEYENRATEMVKAACKKVKENFETLNDLEGVDKKSISFFVDSKDEPLISVDYINVHSPVKRAFFKYRCKIQIS